MEERITGVMIYYYFVCKRKLWYFCHEIRMEAENEDVILGKILDESSYRKNDKHINIDNIINIDFISERKELHEVKKSKAVEEHVTSNVKSSLSYLRKRGVKEIKGKVDYPLLKKSVIVELSDKDIETLEKIIFEIVDIENMDIPPANANLKLCKKCAYYDLCCI